MLADLAVVEAQGAAQRVPAVILVLGLPGHRGHPHPHPLAGEHGPGGGEDPGHQPVLSSHAGLTTVMLLNYSCPAHLDDGPAGHPTAAGLLQLQLGGPHQPRLDVPVPAPEKLIRAANDPSVFTITEKTPTWAFS